MSLQRIQPHDDIGPLLRSLESAVDSLQEVNPLRLAGDLARIKSMTDALSVLESVIRHSHRKHG